MSLCFLFPMFPQSQMSIFWAFLVFGIPLLLLIVLACLFLWFLNIYCSVLTLSAGGLTPVMITILGTDPKNADSALAWHHFSFSFGPPIYKLVIIYSSRALHSYNGILSSLSSGHTHISAMLSGRLAGMAVSPLPLQSTMLLLQVHMAGQEPAARLHDWGPEFSEWPANIGKVKGKVWINLNIYKQLYIFLT